MPSIYDSRTGIGAMPVQVLDSNGAQITSFGATPADSATVSNVNDAATNATILSADTARKGFRLYNDSEYGCYVKYGATATTSDFSIFMPAGSTWVENSYRGQVDGIWEANGSGAMRVTTF